MPTTRRTFLRAAALAGGATCIAALRDDAVERALALDHLAGGRTPEDLAADETFWFDVQQAFMLDRNILNLNNGGVSPSPRVVHESYKRHLDFANNATAWVLWQVQDPEVEPVRRRLAEHFGCDGEEIAITRNASESLQTCLLGIDLQRGDEVLTTNQDYPRMLTTLKQRAAREGIVLKTFSMPVPAKSMDELAQGFESQITPRTRLILMSHIVNITGQIYPVRRVVETARKRNIPVVVDGAHAFAHFQFKQADLNCDMYGVSLHKWLTAPVGTGLLYVRRDRIKDIWPLMAAPQSLRGDIRKYEEIGTHPAANRLAIAEALTFFEGIGPARKEARLRYLRDRWAKRLMQDKRIRLLTNLDPAMSCGIGLVQIEGIETLALSGHLWGKHRIMVSPIVHDEFQGIRITPNVYSTLGEIDTFCRAMEDVIARGLPAVPGASK